MVSVDDDWKKAVLAELEKRGWSQADLARKLSVRGGAITGLLKPIADGGVKQSRLVTRVHELFGWANTNGPAVPSPLDNSLKRVTRKWPTLSDADRERIAGLVDSLASKR